MNTIQLEKSSTKHKKPFAVNFSLMGLLGMYKEYADSKNNDKIYWYLKAIIIIPCVIMVPTTMVMKLATPNFVWFISLSMILFFINIMLHITEQHSDKYVPFYHFSILTMILIPVITYLINL